MGVCGGVPQYADYYKHVRLGDIIVSSPNNSLNISRNGGTNGGSMGDIAKNGGGGASKSSGLDDYFYLYCDKVISTTSDDSNNNMNTINTHNNSNTTNNNLNNSVDNSPAKQSLNGGMEVREFSVKGWCPEDHVLLKLAKEIALGQSSGNSEKGSGNGTINSSGSTATNAISNSSSSSGWQRYLQEGQQQLEGQEVKFSRPPPETDRLFMALGGDDVIEVGGGGWLYYLF